MAVQPTTAGSFTCSVCGGAMAPDDYYELGLRLPDPGESREEYCDAELIDSMDHLRCVAAATAAVDAPGLAR